MRPARPVTCTRRGLAHDARVRVLFAITKGEVGGAQAHVMTLLEGFIRRGVSVELLVEPSSALESWADAAGVPTRRWPSIHPGIDPVADLRARRELVSAVRAADPDVLHLHSSKAGLLGRGVLRGRGITVFTCHHAPYGPGRRWSHRLLARPLDQLTLPSLDGIVTVGARDVPLLRKIAPRVPIRVIRNAVAVAQPPATGDTPSPVAVWVARMAHPKDPMQAVRAWELVVRSRPDARLLMCGVGPLLDEVRHRVAASSAVTAIEVLGQVEDLRQVWARGSLFLLTTNVEGGTTIATLEAMREGLVPVVSDAGDAFLLEHARAGVVVPRRAPRAVADAVLSLLRSPGELRALRANALAFARDGWSVDDMVEETLAFYRDLLAMRTGSHRPPPQAPVSHS